MKKFFYLITLAVLTICIPAMARAAEYGTYSGQFLGEGIFGLKKNLPEGAPIPATADWTLNFWIRPDAPPPSKAILAGFGSLANVQGTQRYLATFIDGIRFWGGSIDVLLNERLEPNKWQMLTAVHGAGILTLYKDGRQVASQAVQLADTQPEINLAPLSPWPDGDHFGGKIAMFTLQDRALSADEVQALFSTDTTTFDKLTFEKGAPEHWSAKAEPTATGNPNQDPASFPKSLARAGKPREADLTIAKSLAPHPQGGFVLAGPWKLAEGSKVKATGEELSRRGVPGVDWYDATVPGTVLTTLVDRGVYPDPYFGLNNMEIPESLHKQDYWYRLQFEAPKNLAGKNVTITFNGINYKAEVWLNGERLGDITGAFIRGIFDVTGKLRVGAQNILAVRISPPPNPGIPHEQSLAAGAGPNGGAMCYDGPTFFCSEGWDWIPGIRDRNIGIWQDVVLSAAGPVQLGDPRVVTRVPEPVGSRADVSISAEVVNRTNVAQTGKVRGAFEGVTFEKALNLGPGATAMVEFTPGEFPQLAVRNPRLWWPNGYGKPELYHLSLAFEAADRTVSDTKQVHFGMREMSFVVTALSAKERLGRYEFFPAAAMNKAVFKTSHESLVKSPKGWIPSLAGDAASSPGLKESTSADTDRFLEIRVNGQRIPMRGGNWGMDDAMKRVSREKIEPYIRLQRDANFNVLRNWCGQSTEKILYDLCDEYGILVWNEFWLTTQWNNFAPLDTKVLLANVEDTIKRFRNHPSIAIWCGRNEGVPPPEINAGIEALIRKYDGTRYYQPNSIEINLSGSGPWSYLNPEEYFRHEGFTTELGLPSPLTADGIRAMMDPADLWPFNDVWAYHDWIPSGAMDTAKYMAALTSLYGEPKDFDDFVRKAQMVNFVSHRAMFEGLNAALWKPSTGRLMWMSHPSWPSMVWQIYGHDYEPNASFYGVKKANEPIHVQMNLPDYALLVSNTTTQPLKGAKVTAAVYDINGALVSSKETTLDVPINSTVTSFKIDAVAPGTVRFVVLELRDSLGKPISENFYWQAANDADYLQLDSLPKVKLVVRARKFTNSGKIFAEVEVSNPSKTIALMAHLTLRNASNNERILPAFATENYLNLLPGQKRKLLIECSLKSASAPLAVGIDGWNAIPDKIRLN